jgi:PAS domain-containing protein
MILASEGYTDKQISTELGISTDTVSTYWRRILSRYRASSRTEVIATLYREHMVETDLALEGLQVELRNRRFAERNLEVSLIRLRTLMNQISSAVLFENEQRQILFVNRAFTEVFGADCDTAQLNGRPSESMNSVYESFFVEPKVVLDYLIESVKKEGEPGALRAEMVNGRVMELSYSPIRSEADRLGHMWHFRDVTPMAVLEVQAMMGTKIAERAKLMVNELLMTHPEGLETFARGAITEIGQLYCANRIHIYSLSKDSNSYREWMSWSNDGSDIKVQEIGISFYGHSQEEATQILYVPTSDEGVMSASTAVIRRLVALSPRESAVMIPVLNEINEEGTGRANAMVAVVFESSQRCVVDGYAKILGSFFTLLASRIKTDARLKTGK